MAATFATADWSRKRIVTDATEVRSRRREISRVRSSVRSFAAVVTLSEVHTHTALSDYRGELTR